MSATHGDTNALNAAIPLKPKGLVSEIAGPILFSAPRVATFLRGGGINLKGGSVLCG